MMRFFVYALLTERVFAHIDYGQAALDDEILDLPGAPAVPFRMFSGYIDVTPPDQAAGTRMMFYWFVESQTSPENSPLMLWTNGGPGCSGLSGFMTEQGPFRPNADGKTLSLNDHAWNKLANMVFIEQPVGVGFSTVKGNMMYGDQQAAEDNRRFVVGFFKRYSQYLNQYFYISSESYGGHYMPTLATELVKAGVDNFKGVFLGNPLTYMPYRNYGQYGTAYGHQLLPKPLWDQYEAAHCRTSFPVSDACSEITNKMDTILAGFDAYALDFPVCKTNLAAGRHERYMMKRMIQRAESAARGESPALEENTYQPCSSDYATVYLNQPAVRAAIHVHSDAQWSQCANIDYSAEDVNKPMMPYWSALLEKTHLKMMIYSGDDDSVCATLGTQQFIWNLTNAKQDDKPWQPWMFNNQTAGFVTDFNGGQFSFVTVHGAGHMVPATQPERSLALLQAFLSKGTQPPVGGSVIV